jgi:hypothetical protein
MSNMTVGTTMSNTTTPTGTTTPVTTTPTETTTPVTTTPTETQQYAVSPTTVSSSSGASSDEIAAWVAGIVIFSIVTGIGIWTAVRRR